MRTSSSNDVAHAPNPNATRFTLCLARCARCPSPSLDGSRVATPSDAPSIASERRLDTDRSGYRADKSVNILDMPSAQIGARTKSPRKISMRSRGRQVHILERYAFVADFMRATLAVRVGKGAKIPTRIWGKYAN